MSTLIRRGESSNRNLKIAILLGALWAVAMTVLWLVSRREGGMGKEEGRAFVFLGRFHPMVVHLPIGLIFLVPLLEWFGRRDSTAYLREAAPLVLWLALLGALGSTVAGYLLMIGEESESPLMNYHLWSGVGVGVAILLALIFRLTDKVGAYLLCLAASLFLTAAAGHFGAGLVHGPTYLTAHAPGWLEWLKPILSLGMAEPKEEEPPLDPVTGEPEEGEGEKAFDDKLVFADFVMPVMEAKCTECHNAEKTKGKLRLDTHEFILTGAEGSDYQNVVPGKSDESEMIVRVTLPDDDDDFMPPDGKDPLTPEEIKLLRWWIDAGAPKDTTVADAMLDDEMTSVFLAVEAGIDHNDEATEALAGAAPLSEWDLLSPEERQTRLDEVLAASEQYHFSIMPISSEDDHLRVNVINAAKEFGDDQLKALEPVAERVVWLDLGRSQVSDLGLKTVARMRNLERLHLENTKITDAGVAELARLAKLEYLNLYGTPVTSAIFEPLANMRNLRKLYLWQTKVEPGAAKSFQRAMSLEVNIGYEPEAAPAASPEKPAAVEPAKKPDTPAPKKPEAPKPAPKKADAPKPQTPAPKPAPKTETKPTPPPAAKKADTTPPTPKPADTTPKPAPPPAPKAETPKKDAA
ncbi:MAG: hypothetical protein H7A53_13735 [Akkermansiaceae bacterium]|nr:hypothetical protein [Akkermansiaceae bacterium]MCP5551943.1 hypothetical protein [Akkermansiaceae bacterium]